MQNYFNFQLKFDNLFAEEKPANTLAVSIRNEKFQEKYNPSHHLRTNPTLFPAILHSSHTILHSLFLAKQCSRYVLAFMLDLAYVQPFMSKHLIESNSSTNVKGKQKRKKKFDSISIKFQGSFRTIADVSRFATFSFRFDPKRLQNEIIEKCLRFV